MKTSSYISALFFALLVFLSLGSSDAYAQKVQGSKVSKEYEAKKIAFLTAEVGITPDEATSFWPVYNEYSSKRRVLRKKAREAKSAEENMANKEAKLALEKEYLAKFKGVLPENKVDKLFEAEKKWRQKLLEEIKNREER